MLLQVSVADPPEVIEEGEAVRVTVGAGVVGGGGVVVGGGLVVGGVTPMPVRVTVSPVFDEES